MESKCVVVITSSTPDQFFPELSYASAYADLIEVRLDFFHAIEEGIGCIEKGMRIQSVPLLATIRTKKHGGKSDLSVQEYLKYLWRLGALKVPYIDVESWIPKNRFAQFSKKFPESRIILSYHGVYQPFLALRLKSSFVHKPAFLYKIALLTCSEVETFHLLSLQKKSSSKWAWIDTSSHGFWSKGVQKVCGSPVVYSSRKSRLLQGHIAAEDLFHQFHIHKQSTKTAIYGLLGDPVSHSIGPITHNALCRHFGIDGVYVPIRVTSVNLPHVMRSIRHLPFRGLSVTMPHKQSILPFLDRIDPICAAVNTVVVKEKMLFGYNTDGPGAIEALQRHIDITNKRCAIIGAGGVAYAIGTTVRLYTPYIGIFSRTKEPGVQLAKMLSAEWIHVDDTKKILDFSYDILIQCTPAPFPIAENAIVPKCVVMDVQTLPLMTEFVQCAKKKKCTVVYGYELFIEQACLQWNLWDGKPKEAYRSFLRETVEAIIRNSP